MSQREQITRRHWLAATSSGVLCTPWIVPASALGRSPRPAPSDRVRVGMIGVGRQAYNLNLKQLLSMPEVEIVAVCDVDSWRLENARRRVEEHYAKSRTSNVPQGCATHVDFQEMLARQDIDAVMISSPDHWHVPMAIAAFEAGKDVSLEKPITRTIAEGRQLAEAAEKHKRVFRVDSELRSVKTVHRAAELCRNGRIGEIHTVTVGVPGSDVGCPPQPDMPVPPELDYERWQGPAPRAPYTLYRVHPPKSYERPGWMRHLYYCDGMITNWGTHWNDGAMWCANLERTGPVFIEAKGDYPPPESFWNVLLSFECKFRFQNGVNWTYKTDKPYLKIEGSAGWVYADYEKIETHPANLADSEISASEIHLPFKSDKQDFIDCVRTRAETLEPAEVGHRVTSLGHLGHIAIRLGQSLTFDPTLERFHDNDQANSLINNPIYSIPSPRS